MSAAASPENERGGAPRATLALAGVAELAQRFDGFILDQWGVLHDGVQPYPGALECVRRLRAAGKRLVLLSNTGQSAERNLDLMQDMGFDRGSFERFVGAGEDARAALAERRAPFHSALGRRCYAFTRAGNHSLVDGIGLELVASVEEAEFLLVIGIDSPPLGVADYEPLLSGSR